MDKKFNGSSAVEFFGGTIQRSKTVRFRWLLRQKTNAPHARDAFVFWRHHPESNWRMAILQTAALPLGYGAVCGICFKSSPLCYPRKAGVLLQCLIPDGDQTLAFMDGAVHGVDRSLRSHATRSAPFEPFTGWFKSLAHFVRSATSCEPRATRFARDVAEAACLPLVTLPKLLEREAYCCPRPSPLRGRGDRRRRSRRGGG